MHARNYPQTCLFGTFEGLFILLYYKVNTLQHITSGDQDKRDNVNTLVNNLFDFVICHMLDVLGWTPLSQMRQEARLILFYKIINGLAQVPFEGVLVEAYEGTRRKYNMKFRQIGHTTSQYGQSFFFLKTISAWNGLAFAEAPTLAVFRSNILNN